MRKIEVVMDVHHLQRQGLSEREIARQLGKHRNTVRRYLQHPEEAIDKRKSQQRGSILDPYMQHIELWLKEDGGYRASRIYDRLCELGYTGSYDLVQRAVKGLKAERQQVAYVRFETDPGQQAQVDFGEFQVDMPDGSSETLYVFAMILSYCRELYAVLLSRCRLQEFLDCHIAAFDYFSGVPREVLYDRMRHVYLGRVAGRTRFNPSLLSMGLHYGFCPRVAPAYAAWVKGKVERPFDFIREGFWRGYKYVDLATANRDLWAWLQVKRERIHGTTRERISVRFEREQQHLQPVPVHVFDTSGRQYRRVNKDCTIRVMGNSYVVDHRLVGQQVLARIRDDQVRIFDGDRLVVSYAMPVDKGRLVQDPRFYAALRQDAAMNARKYAHRRPGKGRAKATISPAVDHHQWQVETRSVDVYDGLLMVAEGGQGNG